MVNVRSRMHLLRCVSQRMHSSRVHPAHSPQASVHPPEEIGHPPTLVSTCSVHRRLVEGLPPNLPTVEHMGLATIAAMHPRARQWHYAQPKGLPFGVGSPVNQLSRAVAFVAAVSRRLLYTLCGNYVDGMALLEMYAIAHCSSSAASCARTLADLMGAKCSPDKTQPPASMVNFLGHLHDVC